MHSAVDKLQKELNNQRLEIRAADVLFVMAEDGNREVLGRGGFGSVYLAEYIGAQVAVKELKEGSITDDNLAGFVKELKLTSTLRHPNIVQVRTKTRSEATIIVVSSMSDPRGTKRRVKCYDEERSEVCYCCVSSLESLLIAQRRLSLFRR